MSDLIITWMLLINVISDIHRSTNCILVENAYKQSKFSNLIFSKNKAYTKKSYSISFLILVYEKWSGSLFYILFRDTLYMSELLISNFQYLNSKYSIPISNLSVHTIFAHRLCLVRQVLRKFQTVYKNINSISYFNN